MLGADLQWFIDDSGNEPGTAHFLLGGFLSTVERWAEFSNEWRGALSLPPKLAYFKMSEAMSFKGQFDKRRGWTEALRDDRLVTLGRIIQSSVRLSVSAVIRHDHFDKYLRSVPAKGRSLGSDNPYPLLFLNLVPACLLLCARNGIREKCDFVVDEQLGMDEEIAHLWPQFLAAARKHGPALLPLIGSPPIFRNEEEFLPLQAADYFAWQARNHYANNQRVPHQTIRIPPNRFLQMFDKIPTYERAIDEPELKRDRAILLDVGEHLKKTDPTIRLVAFDPMTAKRERRHTRKTRKGLMAKRKKKPK